MTTRRNNGKVLAVHRPIGTGMPDRELADTVEFSPWDDGLSALTVRQRSEDSGEPRTGGRIFAAAARVLDRAWYAHFQLRELFTSGRFLSPDEPVPYVLTEKALALLDAARGSGS